MDSLVERAKSELMVTLPGDRLPGAANVEMLVAAWSIAAAREAAWVHSEVLARIQDDAFLAERFVSVLDSSAALAGSALLSAALLS